VFNTETQRKQRREEQKKKRFLSWLWQGGLIRGPEKRCQPVHSHNTI